LNKTKLNLAFEYQGYLHTKTRHGKKTKKAIEALEYQKYKDKVKRRKCKENGVILIAVPEFKYNTEEYALPIIMDLIKKAGIKI
jgi:hypothetical protein